MSSSMPTDDLQELPDPGPVLDLLNGFRRSKTMFALVSLAVPDVLSRHPGRQLSLVQLCRAVGQRSNCEPSMDGLGRLLDTAVSIGLLTGNREGYSLAPVAEAYLVTDSPYSLAGYVNHSDKILYKLWGGLETSVMTGHNCWGDAFGLDSKDVFARWQEHMHLPQLPLDPALNMLSTFVNAIPWCCCCSMYRQDKDILRFMNGMHGFSKLSARAVMTAFDLAPFTSLVDLGGATGALAVAALELYPQLQAVITDLKTVVDKAQQHFAQPPYVNSEDVLQRLSWRVVDFFDDPLPEGDLFVMSRILHDWEDARCLKLLRRVCEQLPVGGALMICEMLLDEGGTSPPEVLLQSLNMLTQTHGRERKLSEYCHLLETVGFTDISSKRTGTYLDVVLARKGQESSC